MIRHGLSRFHEDLNMIAIIGTSDQPCWLAEACKIPVWGVSGAVWRPSAHGKDDRRYNCKLVFNVNVRRGHLGVFKMA